MPDQLFPVVTGRVLEHPDLEADLTLYVGMELHGYRAWAASFDNDVPVLRPVHRGRVSPWVPGENIASCYHGSHPDRCTENAHPDREVPAETCGCGFWAYIEPDNRTHNRENLIATHYNPEVVTGVVRGYGDVVVQEDGFRSQKAEVLAIAPPLEIHPVVQRWRRDMLVDFDAFMIRTSLSHSGLCSCIFCRATQNNLRVPTLEQLAERYNVPYYNSWDAMVKAHPPTHVNPEYRTSVHPVSVVSTPLVPTRNLAPVGAMQMLSSLQIQFTNTGFTVKRPTQPTFTGTVAQTVKKWWRWALTGNASDKAER